MPHSPHKIPLLSAAVSIAMSGIARAETWQSRTPYDAYGARCSAQFAQQ